MCAQQTIEFINIRKDRKRRLKGAMTKLTPLNNDDFNKAARKVEQTAE